MLPVELKKILVQTDFSEEKYAKEIFDKKQIYLHHTVSGSGVKGDIKHWIESTGRISTPFIIDQDCIRQLFSSKYWAHHLGIKRYIFDGKNLPNINTSLNQKSIAIEIDSWGQLVKGKNNKFYNVYGGEVPIKEVCKLDIPYKVYGGLTSFIKSTNLLGTPCRYYHKYTDKQLEMTCILLSYLGKVYDIDLTYKEDIWDISTRALKGENGLYTHNSVRPDKSDIFPYPPLIELLKTL